jgi:outer membrane protein OmpA-like peptidoglycan-associated protein
MMAGARTPAMPPARVERPANAAAPPPRFEHEAERAAERGARRPDIGKLPPADRAAEKPGGIGQPLPAVERRPMERTLGHSFKDVRVHADTAAADEARKKDARAFTIGRDIYFGADEYKPGTEEGRHILAHELTHTVQQTAGGHPAVQRDPKNKEESANPARLGDAPPGDAFARASGKGPEDDFFLFEKNTADLVAGAGKKLEALLSKHKGTLVVEIHGYASGEGEAEYNVNLAAHRSAAVKAVLVPLLPPGASVELYSHGETDVFGDLKQNRRAGVHVRAVPEAEQWSLDPSAPEGKKTAPAAADQPGVKLGPTINLNLDPGFLYRPSGPGFLTPPLGPPALPPLLQPKVGIDWLSMREPFLSRGVMLNDRDNRAIEENWNRTYLLGLSFGLSPSLASMGANKLTAAAYDIQMSKEAPTKLDLFNQEIKLQGGWSTPIVPLITPEIIKFVTKGKVDLSF